MYGGTPCFQLASPDPDHLYYEGHIITYFGRRWKILTISFKEIRLNSNTENLIQTILPGGDITVWVMKSGRLLDEHQAEYDFLLDQRPTLTGLEVDQNLIEEDWFDEAKG